MTDRALFIGRFQPFHKGHLAVVERLARAHAQVLVAIGSANVSHSTSNPFTAGERIEMITAALDEAGIRNALVIPIPDVGRNALWVSHVTSLVPRFSVVYTNNPLPVRLFQERGYKTAPAPFVERETYEGSKLRRMMTQDGAWENGVPPAVARVLRENDLLERLRDLQNLDAAGVIVEGKEALE